MVLPRLRKMKRLTLAGSRELADEELSPNFGDGRAGQAAAVMG
jgi:hypothetical protein